LNNERTDVSLVLFIKVFAYELERGYPAAVAAYLDARQVRTLAHMKGASKDTACFKRIHCQFNHLLSLWILDFGREIR
jgi:hypothetical protein